MEEFLTAFEFFRDNFPDESLLKSISEKGLRVYESPTYKVSKSDEGTLKYLEVISKKYLGVGYFDKLTPAFRIYLHKRRGKVDARFTPKQRRLLESRGFIIEGENATLHFNEPL